MFGHGSSRRISASANVRSDFGDQRRQELERGMVRVGKERRFAPKSLERLRNGGSGRRSVGTGFGAGAAHRTRAHLIGGALAGPLLAQAAGLLQRTEADAAAAAAAEAETRRRKRGRGGPGDGANADTTVHVPGGGIDAMVLGRLLGALGECAAAARHAPDAAVIAGATLELIACPAVARHPHPHVRQAAMFAAVGAIAAVPPAAAWHAIHSCSSAGTGRGAGGAGSALGRMLAWVEEWAEVNPKPYTPNPKPQTPNPKPQTPNPKPQTPNPKP